MNTIIPEQALYELYLTDVMGTTTPKSEVKRVRSLILSSAEIQREIKNRFGEQINIEDIVEKGAKRSEKRQKDHLEFKEYLKLWDIAAQIAYRNGYLVMALEDNVEETLERIHDAGGRIRIYSSGAVETSEFGMKSNGLDRLIEAYHSSSQPEIGSKFQPEAYREIARQAGIDIKDMVYVTDDVQEAKSAVAAGVGKVFLIDKNATEIGEKDGYTVINSYKQVAKETISKNHKQSGAGKAKGKSAS